MPDVYAFGSLAGHHAAFVFFIAIAAAIGLVIRRLACNAVDNRSRERSGRVAGTIAGAFVTAAIVTAVWFWLWSGFHSLVVDDGRVILRYHMPERDYVLNAADITDVSWAPGPKFTRRLRIETCDQHAFLSMQTRASYLSDELVNAIRKALRPR